MHPPRLLRRFAAVIALAGTLAGGLWPLVAQGGRAEPGLPAVICTATGFHALPGGDPGYPVPRDSTRTKSHCALCLAQPVPALPSASPVPAAFLPVGMPEPPPDREPARRVSAPSLIPPSQAPPAGNGA